MISVLTLRLLALARSSSLRYSSWGIFVMVMDFILYWDQMGFRWAGIAGARRFDRKSSE